MDVREVRTASDLRRFVYFPRELYRDNRCWAPPLWMDERRAYSARTNAILAHSDYSLILAEDHGRVAGRSLVYVDHAFNSWYRSATGFFGAFECVNDFDVARSLDEAAVSWLRGRGMDRIRGPIHPVSESWGFLLDSFDQPPVFMAPYNPAYYNEFAVRLGYHKAKDLLAYDARHERYRIPERFVRFGEKRLTDGSGLALRRLSMKDLVRDADTILSISNEAIKGNWGYVPVQRDEFQDMFRKLKPIADPEAIWFVEDRGRPVGYALGFPDLNVILRRIGGRLFPLGFARLLFGVRGVTEYRLFALAVLPEYHGKGLDVLLYLQLYKALAPRIRRLEANYILEDNARIRNALEKLGLALVKTYRVYEKAVG